jgi:hypothetical protein
MEAVLMSMKKCDMKKCGLLEARKIDKLAQLHG